MSGFEISDAHAVKSAEKINATNGRMRMGCENGLVNRRWLDLNGSVRRKNGQFRRYLLSQRKPSEFTQQRRTVMPKAIAFTMLTPVVLVAVICAAISFHLMPSGLWRIGPVIGVNWDGGAKARFGSVTVEYQSGTWLFERGIISDEGLILECPFINVGPFFLHYCRPHVRSLDV